MFNMQILIDESEKQIDQVCTRYSYGHTMIDEETIKEFEDWVIQEVEGDKLRFSLNSKLHFTSLSPAQKTILIEKISKLPITFKIYVSYRNTVGCNLDAIKYDLLKKSILHHASIQPEIPFKIEKATEYSSIYTDLPQTDTELLDAKDHKSFLIPDVLLGVVCGFLDIQDRSRSSDALLWYELIYNQIRLEVISFDDSKPMYLTRANKLR